AAPPPPPPRPPTAPRCGPPVHPPPPPRPEDSRARWHRRRGSSRSPPPPLPARTARPDPPGPRCAPASSLPLQLPGGPQHPDLHALAQVREPALHGLLGPGLALLRCARARGPGRQALVDV